MAREIEEPTLTAAEEIAQYENEVNDGLRKFHNRTHWQATEEKTPVDYLLATESEALSALTLEQLRERLAAAGVTLSVKLPAADYIAILRAMAWDVEDLKKETVRRMYDFFSQDGIDPRSVLRAVYAVGGHMGISPFCDLNLRERALMLGDSHESERLRTRKLCVDPLRRRGVRAHKAPGMKSLASGAKYSITAQGNSNRKRKMRSRRKKTNHGQNN